MGALYNLLMLFLAPIWAPLLWWKNRKRQDKVSWKERQGEFPIAPRGVSLIGLSNSALCANSPGAPISAFMGCSLLGRRGNQIA